MPYIGSEPSSGLFQELDALTASATDDYTLKLNGADYFPETVNNLLVSINGVIQGGSTMALNGAVLTVGATLSSADTIDFVRVFGNVGSVLTPTDGSVTANKIGSGAVVLTSKVSGVLPVANGGTGINSSLAFFSISGSASTTTNQSYNKIQYSTVVLDTKSGWDSSNKWWEVPTSGAGYYHITAQLLLGSMSTNQIEVRIYKNADTIVNAVHFDAKNTGTGATVYHSFPVTLNTVEQLSADDYIWVAARIADGNGNIQSNGCTLTIRQVQ